MRKYIILADDNKDHADLIKLSFNSLNISHDILHLNNGKEVLDFFDDLSNSNGELDLPELLVMDLRMPKVNGIEVAKQLKNSDKYSFIPIVILTSSENSSDISEAYNVNVNSYLIKPVEYSELSKLISNIYNYWLVNNNLPYNLNNK